MSINKGAESTGEIISFLRRFSGRKDIDFDDMIGRDLGITGGDGVQILYELEERFGVDLDPLIQAHTDFLPRRWFDKFLGRSHGPKNADMKVRDLTEYIVFHTSK